MKFYDALKELDLTGRSITRDKWVNVLWVSRKNGSTEIGEMSQPFLFACTSEGDWVPWLPSQADILSDDWAVLVKPEFGMARGVGHA